MEWRRRAAGDYAAGPYTWGRATILRRAPEDGWNVSVWAFGAYKEVTCNTLRNAQIEAEFIREALRRDNQNIARTSDPG